MLDKDVGTNKHSVNSFLEVAFRPQHGRHNRTRLYPSIRHLPGDHLFLFVWWMGGNLLVAVQRSAVLSSPGYLSLSQLQETLLVCCVHTLALFFTGCHCANKKKGRILLSALNQKKSKTYVCIFVTYCSYTGYSALCSCSVNAAALASDL